VDVSLHTLLLCGEVLHAELCDTLHIDGSRTLLRYVRMRQFCGPGLITVAGLAGLSRGEVVYVIAVARGFGLLANTLISRFRVLNAEPIMVGDTWDFVGRDSHAKRALRISILRKATMATSRLQLLAEFNLYKVSES
jgi:hypothetical protein